MSCPLFFSARVEFIKQFHVDSDGTVGAAEGATATNAMDTLDAGKATVQATIEGRGFTNPSYY